MALHIKPHLTLRGAQAKLAAFIYIEHARPTTPSKIIKYPYDNKQDTLFFLSHSYAYIGRSHNNGRKAVRR